jgi:hypothetical protein
MSSKDIYEVMKGLTRDGNLPALDYTPVDVGVKGQRFTWYLHSDLNGCVLFYGTRTCRVSKRMSSRVAFGGSARAL